MMLSRESRFVSVVDGYKKFIFFLLILALPTVACRAQYDDDYLSYDDFYQGLAPYGQWIQDPEYGYVWSPAEDASFRPYYTNGHWVMTEFGNTWVSEYPWGWACFHYGRWTYDAYYGWLWIPGNYWGPAWVSWRVGESFYGWAPLGPDYKDGMSLTSYKCPGDWWVFIPPRYIYSDHYYAYWSGPRDNKKNIKNTRIIGNTFEHGGVVYHTGPHVAQVRQVTGNPVQVFKIRNSKNQVTRVHNGEVRMFRPAEIRQMARVNPKETAPAEFAVAPKPLRAPMEVGSGAGSLPPFRVKVNEEKKANAVTPGTNINQVAEPQKQTKRSENPYEWDVSRHVKQDVAPEPKPRQAPAAPAKPTTTPRQPARPPARPQQPRETLPQRESVPVPGRSQGGR